MNFDLDKIKAGEKHIVWVIDYGPIFLIFLGVCALLSILGSWFFSDLFSVQLTRVVIVLSLIAIAAFIWAIVATLSGNQASIDSLHESVQKQTQLAESRTVSSQLTQDLESRKFAQAQLEFTQAERLYLIEKAQLQPVFKASARAFITPAKDQQAQDDVWDEDAFIAKHFREPDLFGVKLSFRQKGSALFSHERVVFDRSHRPPERAGSENNESYVALDEREKPVYIIPLDELPNGDSSQDFVVFYIYKDLTSLSVVMKYRVYRTVEVDANFWSIENLDICFTNAYQEDLELDSVKGCEKLFTRKYSDPLV